MPLIDLGDDAKARLTSYLTTELLTHDAEIGRLQERWKNEALDYIAEPMSAEDNTYPFLGSSKVIVPLQAIAVEGYHSRTMGQLFGLDDLVTISTDTEHEDIRPGLKKYFNHQFLNVLKFRDSVESPVLECTKHGTGVIAVNYRKTKRKGTFLKAGKETEIEITVEDGTCIDGVPLADFMMPFYSLNTASAPWIGNLVRFSEMDLRQWEAAGWFDEGTYDKLKTYFATVTTDNKKLEAVREATDTTPVFPSEVELYRLFLDFDTGVLNMENKQEELSGELSSLEVYYHKYSDTVCSVQSAGERPYEKGVFFPMEYRWYGLGIAHQVAIFQKEVTTIHRQRLDGNAIANMKMFKVRKTAIGNIKDDEPIFPGKKWFVDEMDDIQELNIGSVAPASYNDENQIVVYTQQRTGINELTMGMPQSGTPGTASDSIARVQESTRKFDYTYNNQKDWLNRVVRRAAKSIIEHSSRDVTSDFQYIPKGSEVESFLNLGDALDNQLLFDIMLAGSKNNKVLDRNTFTQLAGMQTQYWTQVMSLAGQKQDPMLVQAVIDQALAAANKINKEILIAYDIPNPEELLFKIPTSTPQPLPIQPGGVGQPSAPAGPSGSSFSSILAPNARINAGTGSPTVNIGQGGLSFAG